MTRTIRIALASFVLAAVASLSFYAGSASAAAAPHPAIRAAITALEKARIDLKNAAHDFGGHRVQALAATDAAIEQLRICLQYDH